MEIKIIAVILCRRGLEGLQIARSSNSLQATHRIQGLACCNRSESLACQRGVGCRLSPVPGSCLSFESMYGSRGIWHRGLQSGLESPDLVVQALALYVVQWVHVAKLGFRVMDACKLFELL